MKLLHKNGFARAKAWLFALLLLVASGTVLHASSDSNHNYGRISVDSDGWGELDEYSREGSEFQIEYIDDYGTSPNTHLIGMLCDGDASPDGGWEPSIPADAFCWEEFEYCRPDGACGIIPEQEITMDEIEIEAYSKCTSPNSKKKYCASENGDLLGHGDMDITGDTNDDMFMLKKNGEGFFEYVARHKIDDLDQDYRLVWLENDSDKNIMMPSGPFANVGKRAAFDDYKGFINYVGNGRLKGVDAEEACYAVRTRVCGDLDPLDTPVCGPVHETLITVAGLDPIPDDQLCLLGSVENRDNTPSVPDDPNERARVTWDCRGNNGDTRSCYAELPLLAACGPAVDNGPFYEAADIDPLTLCLPGNPTEITELGMGPPVDAPTFNWICEADEDVTCQVLRSVDGVCGAAANPGNTFADFAAVQADGRYCDVGDVLNLTEVNEYPAVATWSCEGIQGGNDSAECTAHMDPTTAVCGVYDDDVITLTSNDTNFFTLYSQHMSDLQGNVLLPGGRAACNAGQIVESPDVEWLSNVNGPASAQITFDWECIGTPDEPAYNASCEMRYEIPAPACGPATNMDGQFHLISEIEALTPEQQCAEGNYTSVDQPDGANSLYWACVSSQTQLAALCDVIKADPDPGVCGGFNGGLTTVSPTTDVNAVMGIITSAFDRNGQVSGQTFCRGDSGTGEGSDLIFSEVQTNSNGQHYIDVSWSCDGVPDTPEHTAQCTRLINLAPPACAPEEDINENIELASDLFNASDEDLCAPGIAPTGTREVDGLDLSWTCESMNTDDVVQCEHSLIGNPSCAVAPGDVAFVFDNSSSMLRSVGNTNVSRFNKAQAVLGVVLDEYMNVKDIAINDEGNPANLVGFTTFTRPWSHYSPNFSDLNKILDLDVQPHDAEICVEYAEPVCGNWDDNGNCIWYLPAECSQTEIQQMFYPRNGHGSPRNQPRTFEGIQDQVDAIKTALSIGGDFGENYGASREVEDRNYFLNGQRERFTYAPGNIVLKHGPFVPECLKAYRNSYECSGSYAEIRTPIFSTIMNTLYSMRPINDQNNKSKTVVMITDGYNSEYNNSFNGVEECMFDYVVWENGEMVEYSVYKPDMYECQVYQAEYYADQINAMADREDIRVKIVDISAQTYVNYPDYWYWQGYVQPRSQPIRAPSTTRDFINRINAHSSNDPGTNADDSTYIHVPSTNSPELLDAVARAAGACTTNSANGSWQPTNDIFEEDEFETYGPWTCPNGNTVQSVTWETHYYTAYGSQQESTYYRANGCGGGTGTNPGGGTGGE